jgi:beta-N-acetylhexosaminidase
MKDVGELTGGISSPVISPSVGEYSTLLQGLILLGMRQIRQQGCNACILDYVSFVLPCPNSCPGDPPI